VLAGGSRHSVALSRKGNAPCKSWTPKGAPDFKPPAPPSPDSQSLPMEDQIRSAIEAQARKLLQRHKAERFGSLKHQRRFRVRTGQAATPTRVRDPGIWSVGPHFNPAYCIKHSRYLAKTIWRKIISRQYAVTPAVLYQIPKDSGGHRDIMVFSIPDAAVANLFNRKMRDRNRNIQSPFCYSYRKDRTIFDAVIQTASMLAGQKTYVVQYDFSKYFDSIRHDYINFILDKNEFFVSPAERHIITSFLSHRFATLGDYASGTLQTRAAGVPQGCSLSLFLSNIAAHELDKQLERSNGSFVRFADDVVAVAHTYSDATNIADAFTKHCHYSGIAINHKKSPGITLFRKAEPSINRDYFYDNGDVGKLTTIDEFDYIGHKFLDRRIGISSRAVHRAKIRASKIIYNHLLLNPRRGLFDAQRVGPGFFDWDLATCLNELRSYIYGGITEFRLRGFLDQNIRISRFKGLMSFYPLVTNVDQFSDLDGWLVSAVIRAHRERARVLAGSFGVSVGRLHRTALIDGTWYNFPDIEIETKLPSFVLGWRAARKAFRQYGLADFELPSYYSTLFQTY
jgi:RNA-directed DNA polymerase